MSAPLDELWGELVTAALLGTDRRNPPDLADGPLADVVADAVRADPAERLLTAVAAVAAARRAAFRPGPPAAALQSPEADSRPVVPAAAADDWRTIVAEWPVLEDEWMLTVIARGWRLSPDVLVAALLRHRGDAVRRTRVVLAGGPLAAWATDHVEALTPRGGTLRVPAEAVHTLPDLPVTPEMAPLLRADAQTFVRSFGAAVDGAGPALKPVLVNLLARCRPEVLADAAAALTHHGYGLALALADLAGLRERALAVLNSSPTS